MTDLQQQITDIIREHPQADEWGITVEECRNCDATRQPTYAEHVADMIIETLGLTPERDNTGGPMGWMTPSIRYVTDWRPA